MFNDARERRDAEPPPDDFAETTWRDKNQAPDPIRTLQEEHLRNASAKGVADDIRLLDTRDLEPASDDACVPVELVAGIRTLRLTVSWQVGHQHTPIRGQQSRHG